MEVLSRKTYVETGKSLPRIYMTAKQLSEYEGMTPAHYRAVFQEIEDQIGAGRYPRAALSDGKPRSVNYYVYRDYIANRKRLKNKNLRKMVKPFNPAEIAALCPLVREVVIMGDE